MLNKDRKQTAQTYYSPNNSQETLKQVEGYDHNNVSGRDNSVKSEATNANIKNLNTAPGYVNNSPEARGSISSVEAIYADNSSDRYAATGTQFGKFRGETD